MIDVWDSAIAELLVDDGSAAKAVLAAGHPIYYVERDTPADLLIKEYPDGRKELVRCDTAIDEVVAQL